MPTRRSTRTTKSTRATGPPASAGAVPDQRQTGIEELGLGVDELVLADHEAQDARLFDALEWASD
jgi:hypothetical protein